MFKKGFTLIELLVVVAIIGVLASIVLVSLSTARVRGVDAAIKATLSQARGQAEIFYGINGDYINVCENGTNAIGPLVLSALQKLDSNATSIVTAGGMFYAYSATGVISGPSGAAVCHSNATNWAAIVSLKKPVDSATGGWCVDSDGRSKESNVLGGGVYACP